MALKNPLVTVCIPVHINHKYVLRAIESVLNQKYSNIELIISINSSTFDRNEMDLKFLFLWLEIDFKQFCGII